MTTYCKRCGKPIKNPTYIDGKPYGPICAEKVRDEPDIGGFILALILLFVIFPLLFGLISLPIVFISAMIGQINDTLGIITMIIGELYLIYKILKFLFQNTEK